ncbi:MAG: DUF2064 domain-containing protein [Saprospiraceae bacterium]
MIPASFDQCAILIFSRTAKHEAAVKIFDHTSGAGKNKAIAKSLIRQTLSTARRTHLPVFFHSSVAQAGNTFAENFADALESIFRRGYHQVIAIGNDCPALNTEDLLAATSQLNTTSLVLGPASDGGAYLIGIHKAAYNRAAFLQIHWQTTLVFEELAAYAGGDFGRLGEKSDVDSLADLAKVVRTDLLPVFLRIRLSNFLRQFFSSGFCRYEVAMPAIFLDYCALRGPPRFLTLSFA